MSALLSLFGIELEVPRNTKREEDVAVDVLGLSKEYQISTSKSLFNVCQKDEDVLVVLMPPLSTIKLAQKKLPINNGDKTITIKWYVGDLGNIYLFSKCPSLPTVLFMRGKEVKGTWIPEMKRDFSSFVDQHAMTLSSQSPQSPSSSFSPVSSIMSEQNDAYSRSLAIDRAKKEEKRRKVVEEQLNEKRKADEYYSHMQNVESLMQSILQRIPIESNVSNENVFALSIQFPMIKGKHSLKIDNVTPSTPLSSIYYRAFHYYLKHHTILHPVDPLPQISDFILCLPSYPPTPLPPPTHSNPIGLRTNTRLIFRISDWLPINGAKMQ